MAEQMSFLDKDARVKIDESDSLSQRVLNLDKNYGFKQGKTGRNVKQSEKGMACFYAHPKGKLYDNNYRVLENEFLGLSYLYFASKAERKIRKDSSYNSQMLHEFFTKTNTSEPAATFGGYGELKTYGRVTIMAKKGKEFVVKKIITFEELRDGFEKGKLSFEDLVATLYKSGYGCKAMADMKKTGFTEHPDESGDLRKRVGSLSDDFKEWFLKKLFYLPRPISNLENSMENDFNDPNDKKLPDRKGRGAYIHGILGIVNQIYKANVKEETSK